MTSEILSSAKSLIRECDLDPKDFCIIKNACFSKEDKAVRGNEKESDKDQLTATSAPKPTSSGLWILGDNFFKTTEGVAEELADWFGDPTILSDWLLDQQERMLVQQPLAVSHFATVGD